MITMIIMITIITRETEREEEQQQQGNSSGGTAWMEGLISGEPTMSIEPHPLGKSFSRS